LDFAGANIPLFIVPKKENFDIKEFENYTVAESGEHTLIQV